MCTDKLVNRLFIFLIFSFIFAANSVVFATTTFTVKKVKGHTAIIETNETLSEGEIFEFGKPEAFKSDITLKDQTSTRDHSISIGADFLFSKASRLQENSFNLDARMGWSHIDYEFGPVLKINLLDQGAGVNSQYAVGGFFDLNLVPNIKNNSVIWGLDVQLTAGNLKTVSGADTQIIAGSAGGFLTYFLSHTNTALRAELLSEIRQIKTEASTTQATGFKSKLLLQFYW